MRAKFITAPGCSPSADVAQLVASLNSLMLLLDNVSKAVVAGDLTAAEGFEAISAAMDAGQDLSDGALGTGYTGSEVEVKAIKRQISAPTVFLTERGFSSSDV